MASGVGMRRAWPVVLLLLVLAGCAGDRALRDVEYPGFTLWVDCRERAAVRFHYLAGRDTGSAARAASFSLDPDIPAACQQVSTASYQSVHPGYDRGHLVPANHLDHLADGIRLSNRMLNVMPQVRGLNRGAWLASEEIVECYRDREPLAIWGGVIWGTNSGDDYFVDSHGVRTPDYFWKLVYAVNAPQRVLAWIMPNRSDAARAQLDGFAVSVAELERRAHTRLGLPSATRHAKVATAWPVPPDCARD